MRASRNLSYIIDKIPEPQPVFKLIQEQSGNDDTEMYGNFNMGADFAVFMPEENVALVQEIAWNKYGFSSGKLGQLEEGPRRVVILPKKIEYKGETLGVR